MKIFGGRVLFLDRSDINTDEIIPAKYLTELTKEALKPHLLEDLKLEGFVSENIANKNARVIVTRSNFGCGSSREHAAWVLEVNDITTVIAQSFARIFRQNMYNCGMMAIELSEDAIDRIFSYADKNEVLCVVDRESKLITFKQGGEILLTEPFSLGDFDNALVEAGGWVEYADIYY